jgi:ferredoxin
MPTVSFNDQEIDCEDGDIVIEVLEKAGIEYPFGCLNGSCGVCAIKVKNKDGLHQPSVIESGTLEEFYFDDDEVRLACRAKIKSDTKLESFKQN